MHSPRRSTRLAALACAAGDTANRLGIQAGKSPPVMSPSRVARTQRAASAIPTRSPPPSCAAFTASWKFSRQR